MQAIIRKPLQHYERGWWWGAVRSIGWHWLSSRSTKEVTEYFFDSSNVHDNSFFSLITVKWLMTSSLVWIIDIVTQCDPGDDEMALDLADIRRCHSSQFTVELWRLSVCDIPQLSLVTPAMTHGVSYLTFKRCPRCHNGRRHKIPSGGCIFPNDAFVRTRPVSRFLGPDQLFL